MKKTFWILSLAAVIAVGSGCQTYAPPGPYRPLGTSVDLENSDRFVLLDRQSQKDVTTTGIQERLTPDGRLQVIAHVRSRTHRRTDSQINCVFKDAQGFVVEETPFQTLILTGNAQEDVTFTATNPNARRYTIRVRESR